MERRRRFWNSRWGRLARRDVLVYEDDGRWLVESREGGAEGRSAWFELASEDEALDRARELMAEGDGWTELRAG